MQKITGQMIWNWLLQQCMKCLFRLPVARQEKVTPWLGADTAKHYQWYPFVNIGHYELIKQLQTTKNSPSAGYYSFKETFWNNADTITGYYREGITRVWDKAKANAFYRGIPFI